MERKPVRYWHLIRRLGLFWVVPPLLFAAIFTTVGVVELRKSALIARDAAQVQGIVVAKWVDEVTRDGQTEYTYRLRYAYAPPERNATLTGTATTSAARFAREEVGAPVIVHYAWSQPDIATLDPDGDRVMAIVFSVFGLVGGSAAFGVAIWMIGRKRSVLRALRWGDVREARVTALRKTGLSKNKVAQYALDWIDATGQSGSSLQAGFEKLSAYPVGSVIVVYVDPKTGRGWWDVQV